MKGLRLTETLTSNDAVTNIAHVWEITYSKTAIRALRRMPRDIAKRIRARINQLATDPYAPDNNLTKLRGSPYFRLRIGDWRIVYELVSDELVISIITIGPRGSVYE
ncbi:MAG: mRNA interferase RelE/StbE [Gammaproteobacteria bacterium]|jgi:mRNA interferase RelE/StbE